MQQASARRAGPRRSVLITGVGGPAGRAAVQSLRALDYHVVGVDMQRVGDCEAQEFALVPPATDADYLPILHALAGAKGASWLFPTVAEELPLIADHAMFFRSAGVAVFISRSHPVAICHDKWQTAQALAAHDIAVPRSALGRSPMRWLRYPLISKPRIGRGGRGVVIHDEPANMDADDLLLWQEFMPGKEYDVQLLIHPDPPFRLLAKGIFEKTQLREGRVGNALALRPRRPRDVQSLAVAAARTLGLAGPLDMDIRRDRDGRPRILEINARIGAHVQMVPDIIANMALLHEQRHLG
ncbi:Carbamoylphosphate synthase large subunit [Sphingobium faniae]|nr:Carbamoylphosphate synthase large subunit [Sphingobium faniae]